MKSSLNLILSCLKSSMFEFNCLELQRLIKLLIVITYSFLVF